MVKIFKLFKFPWAERRAERKEEKRLMLGQLKRLEEQAIELARMAMAADAEKKWDEQLAASVKHVIEKRKELTDRVDSDNVRHLKR